MSSHIGEQCSPTSIFQFATCGGTQIDTYLFAKGEQMKMSPYERDLAKKNQPHQHILVLD